MWFLFQVAIMTLIIGSNGAYHWAGENSGFAVPLLAAFAGIVAFRSGRRAKFRLRGQPPRPE
jgi:hypothetical protein